MQYLANKRIYIYEYTKEPDITLTPVSYTHLRAHETIAMATASSFLDFGDSLFTMFFNQFVYIGVSKFFCLGKACASRFLLL